MIVHIWLGLHILFPLRVYQLFLLGLLHPVCLFTFLQNILIVTKWDQCSQALSKQTITIVVLGNRLLFDVYYELAIVWSASLYIVKTPLIVCTYFILFIDVI